MGYISWEEGFGTLIEIVAEGDKHNKIEVFQGGRRRGHMGYVSNFQHEAKVESKEAFKTIWESILLAVVVFMVIVTVIALVSPDTAAVILGYFL